MGRDTEVICGNDPTSPCGNLEPCADHPRVAAREWKVDNAGVATPPAVGKKLDAGKAPIFQGVINYFPRAIKAVAEVSVFGATKYKLSLADKNWLSVENGYLRYTDALGRHFVDSATELTAADSLLLHDAHAAWNALARLELLMIDLEEQEAVQPKG